ncbi:LuxR C-terminal-related transcriptional regulator [Capillimicrobium parvum]|nr:LuxR C-terminal-related transcriptional regulator [Capillimicrobium parvum]
MTVGAIAALEPSLGSDRFAETLARLDELGPPSELLERAPAEAAAALDLDRIVLSRVDNGRLTAQSLHAPAWQYSAEDALIALRAASASIDYPSVEGEVLRRRRPQLVRVAEGDPVERRAYADVMGWREYVVAPIMLEGRVIGFFHGDRHAGNRALDEQDAANMGTFALCFAIVYERAILRTRLRIQRQEMRQIASWAASRTSELTDRAIALGPDDFEAAGGSTAAGTGTAGRGDGTGESALQELLTRRELEVLRLMVQGRTNADIAREFVVSQGTVKFHVKNILRKLHAANRAEATSRYLRLTLGQGGPAGS